MAENGFTIVEHLLDGSETDAVVAALRPLREATPFGENDFTGFRTRGVFNLMAKTRALDAALLDADLVRSALGPCICSRR